MSRSQRLTFLGIAALIAVVAIVVLLVAGGGSDDEQEAAATPTATAAPGADATETPTPTPTATATPKPQPPLLRAGKVTEIEVKEGQTVRFRVTADEDEEIHVHGYDIEEEVPAGGTAKFDFPADLEGVFEVELHGSETQIAELTVNP